MKYSEVQKLFSDVDNLKETPDIIIHEPTGWHFYKGFHIVAFRKDNVTNKDYLLGSDKVDASLFQFAMNILFRKETNIRKAIKERKTESFPKDLDDV